MYGTMNIKSTQVRSVLWAYTDYDLSYVASYRGIHDKWRHRTSHKPYKPLTQTLLD
jgi:hypothetical protein